MTPTNTEITPEHLARYFHITETALATVRPCAPEGAGLSKTEITARGKHTQQILSIAKQYTNDARHFEKQGDFVRAFAALNYAHGWLDCGAALGLITGKGSDLERWEE